MSSETAESRGYADPVVVGVALGLVLFGVILLAGRGLGASGAFAASSASVVHLVAPAKLTPDSYLARWVPEHGLLGEWIVVEILGVILGGWASAVLAGRARLVTERAGESSDRGRLLAALTGGCLMGAGARLARGCTSGLGLTGGALLATGAWVFIPVAFGTAFLTAWVRRQRRSAP